MSLTETRVVLQPDQYRNYRIAEQHVTRVTDEQDNIMTTTRGWQTIM
jgi:hypothetical protein